jgi:ABC-type glycerol-3-phosphate transport system substrate-binding protein
VLSRRGLLRLTLAAPLVAACDARPLYGIPVPTPTPRPGTPVATKRRVLLWHGDAVNGERAFARELGPRLVGQLPDVQLEPLAYGDPDELLRRVANAAAGGVGPDVLQLPGEWLPEAVGGKIVAPLPAQLSTLLDPKDWTPNTLESGRWSGTAYGLPAAVHLRQPYYNDELLRNAGLVEAGRTTPPNTWAELTDVSRRVGSPDERWGSQLPSSRADETLFRHVVQHVHTAGGELPRREGTRVALDTPAMREALQYLLDLVQKNGGVPLDRQLFRLAESGKLGLWWGTTGWLGDAAATGVTLRVGATPIPRNRRGGALVRTLHWCLGAHASQPDAAAEVLARLADDETSHRYCAALSLPPIRRANWTRPLYTQPAPEAIRSSAAKIWPPALEQLNSPENVALVGFPGYRTAAARFAGELVLVLTGKKPIPTALSEGEAGVTELLKKEP